MKAAKCKYAQEIHQVQERVSRESHLHFVWFRVKLKSIPGKVLKPHFFASVSALADLGWSCRRIGLDALSNILLVPEVLMM
jgi:hypothetical protein